MTKPEIRRRNLEIRKSGTKQVRFSSRGDNSRLTLECAKLNKSEERAMAEESLRGNIKKWPAY
jgi:hypothetical protein